MAEEQPPQEQEQQRQEDASEQPQQPSLSESNNNSSENATPLPPAPAPSAPEFDPSRMVGIIKRKALIKDLAAAYHAECLAHCQELLHLQRKWAEEIVDLKIHEETKKSIAQPRKRTKICR